MFVVAMITTVFYHSQCQSSGLRYNMGRFSHIRQLLYHTDVILKEYYDIYQNNQDMGI